MEKQYIFFNTSKAFWFCAACGLAMFFFAIFAGVYLKLKLWQFGIFAFLFSAFAIFMSFKIDNKKKRKLD